MVERLLIGVLYHLSRYKTTTADYDVAEYVNNVSAISFARFATANFHYGFFDELVEGSLIFLRSDKPKNRSIGTHYGRYVESVAGPRVSVDDTV